MTIDPDWIQVPINPDRPFHQHFRHETGGELILLWYTGHRSGLGVAHWEWWLLFDGVGTLIHGAPSFPQCAAALREMVNAREQGRHR